MLKIIKITDKEGNERTDGKYPSRKGCIGKMYCMDFDIPMLFKYTEDNQGNEKSGYLRSSIVEDYELLESGVTVYTMNSVYYFEKL